MGDPGVAKGKTCPGLLGASLAGVYRAFARWRCVSEILGGQKARRGTVPSQVGFSTLGQQSTAIARRSET